MKQSIRLYITLVALACVSALVVLVWMAPTVEWVHVRAVITISVIALVTHLMGHTLSKSAHSIVRGSVSFVPFLAGAILSPDWTAMTGVLTVLVIVQVVRRRSISKSLFNVCQVALAVSLAILAYRLLGGVSILDHQALNYPALVAVLFVYSAVNTLLVAAVVGISEHRGIIEVWTENTLGTVMYALLGLPLIVGLAWVYARFGPPGAFVAAVSLLGLRELYRVNLELETANQELLELMVAAIEARDPYTSGHSRRVSQNAKTIAQIAGLSAREVKRVEVAALLHDVGKIHEVFAPILQKPGRLTDEENAIMQTHPIKSEELVARVSQLHDIVPAVRHHHENWNGTGYPDGLAGEKIPLGSRIIMFADTIDAMTSDRPYRKALDAEAVREELVKHRARQFDPQICDALLSSPRFKELFRHSGHTSLSHTQEMPKLRLAVSP
jgi:hypothetical protein